MGRNGRTPRRGPALPFLVIFAILGGLGAASCYSTNYRDGITVNVTLLTQLSDKLADYCRAGFVVNGRQVSSEEMGEFYYALKKARAFSETTAREQARESHRDFNRLLDAYEEFAHWADEFRLAGAREPAKLTELMARHQEVSAAAARVLADLKSEAN